MSDSIFAKIVRGELPSCKVWEDEDLLVILDIEPVNKGHALILTKQPYADARDVPDAILGKILPLARDIGVILCREFGYSGFNIHQSNGPDAGQDVIHYHLHVWPRCSKEELRFVFKEEVTYKSGEIAEVADRIERALRDRLSP